MGASCMREWTPASPENAPSPDDGGRSTHRSAKLAALDLPPRWFGLYSAGTPGQLHLATPGKHGRTDHRVVRAARRIVVVLRFDGDRWFGDRRVRSLPLGAQRREGNAGPQVSAQEAGENLQDFRPLGFWRYRHSGLAATPCAHGSLRFGRGSHAI